MATARIGRPRSETARQAILGAALALLDEKGGAALSIEAVARRAGVGKPTLYRWWPTLADLVLEALLQRADDTIAVPPGGSLRETLRSFLRQSMTAIADGGGVHLRFLMARAQLDEGFRQRFRDTFAARRRAVLKSIFLRAAELGEIGPGHDLDMPLDLIFGAMWYRLLIGHAALDEAFADALTEAALAPLKPPPASPSRVMGKERKKDVDPRNKSGDDA